MARRKINRKGSLEKRERKKKKKKNGQERTHTGRIHTDFSDSDDKYVSLLMHVETIGGLIATI